MRTPDERRIEEFTNRLEGTIGDNLLSIVLHGSVLEDEDKTDYDNRDADLVIVVSDSVLEHSRVLINNIRWSEPFKEFNFAINTVGYYQLIQFIRQRHPFFIGALLNGHPLYSLNDYYDELKNLAEQAASDVDFQQLIQLLENSIRAEESRASACFREIFKSLTNLLYARVQIAVLEKIKDEPPAEVMKNLANWPWLIKQIESMKLPEDKISFLNRLYESKAQVSRYKQPEIGADLFNAIDKLHQPLVNPKTGTEAREGKEQKNEKNNSG